MSRTVLYVAHPLAPTEQDLAEVPHERIERGLGEYELDVHHPILNEVRQGWALEANLNRALRWLAWLRKPFPETTFIAPWIATVMSLDGDHSPGPREAGLVDDCAVVERCDGIVLCGARISSGMQREREHGRLHYQPRRAGPYPNPFVVYDLTGHAEPPLTVGPVDMTLAAAQHIMRRGG